MEKSYCFELKIKPIYPNRMSTLHELCLQLKASLKDHFSERMKICGLYIRQMSKTVGLCIDALPLPSITIAFLLRGGGGGGLYTG